MPQTGPHLCCRRHCCGTQSPPCLVHDSGCSLARRRCCRGGGAGPLTLVHRPRPSALASMHALLALQAVCQYLWARPGMRCPWPVMASTTSPFPSSSTSATQVGAALPLCCAMCCAMCGAESRAVLCHCCAAPRHAFCWPSLSPSTWPGWRPCAALHACPLASSGPPLHTCPWPTSGAAPALPGMVQMERACSTCLPLVLSLVPLASWHAY